MTIKTDNSRFDGKEFWKPRKARASTLHFVPGQRLDDSLFTVIGPGYMDRFGNESWLKVRVFCDPQYGGCGATVDISYGLLYHVPPKYSCGCIRKPRWNEHDHQNTSWTGYYTKRKITILYFDQTYKGWVYVCECCAEVGVIPQGLGMTTSMKLKAIANRECPNRAVFQSVEQLQMFRSGKAITKVEAESDLASRIRERFPEGSIEYDGYRVMGVWIRPDKLYKLWPFNQLRVTHAQDNVDKTM